MLVVQQLLMFTVVGGLGFIADAGTLHILVNNFSRDLYSSRVLSYLFAATLTWVLHRRFTFSDSKSSNHGREWCKYIILNGIGGGLNYVVYAFLVFNYPLLHDNPVLAVAAGSIVGLVVNFTVSKYWVFSVFPR